MQQNSRAIRLSEGDGRAADVQSKGHAESKQRDLTEAAFGLLHPRESLESEYNQLEDQCCWAVEVGDVRLDKSLVSVKQVSPPSQAQWGSCPTGHAVVIWAYSGAPVLGTVSSHPSG